MLTLHRVLPRTAKARDYRCSVAGNPNPKDVTWGTTGGGRRPRGSARAVLVPFDNRLETTGLNLAPCS